MLPNMDLIVAALIHAIVIACVLLAAVFVFLNAILLALIIALFCIPIIDVHDAVSFLSRSRLLNSWEANFHLGSFLVVYFLLSNAIPLLGDDSASAAGLLYKKLEIVGGSEFGGGRRRRISRDG
ncbi:hypothetical protein LINPERPRIM_LOCUS1418 [Linum perenne]